VNVRGRVLEREANGHIRRSAGTVTDIGKRKQAELLLQAQHEFAGLLLSQPDRSTLLRAILDSALRLPGFDGGGLYWRDDDGGYRLIVHHGFSPEFIAAVGQLAPDSSQAAVIREGGLICCCTEAAGHCNRADLLKAPPLVAEGVTALVVLPIVVTVKPWRLNLASAVRPARRRQPSRRWKR
jgi:hypothetical protein